MRSEADLQRHAQSVGGKLVATFVDEHGRRVGVFDVPDIEDGKPMATATLLEGLASEDDMQGAVPPALAAWARVAGPKALHQWVQSHVKFRRENVETFASPLVTIQDGAGDCDDSARALVAIARAAGIPARLVYFLQRGQPAHVCAQLALRAGSGAPAGSARLIWKWSETTIPARFGEHPFAAMDRLHLAREDIGGAPYVLRNGKAVRLTDDYKPGSMHGMSNLGDNFAASLVSYSQSIGANPYDVLKLLISESGLNPAARNYSGFASGQYAAGLNQLAPTNWGIFAPMSADDYTALSAADQLPYVFKFWQNAMNAHGLSSISARDLYWINFLPAYFVPNASDGHVIVDSSSGYYRFNTGLDHGNKGYITAGDLQQSLDAQANTSIYQSVAAQLENIDPLQMPVSTTIAALLLVAGFAIGAAAADPQYVRQLVLG